MAALLKPIAHIECALSDKFGLPRQSNLVPGLKATIVFEPEYRDASALRGLKDFSYIWLIWGFSKARMDKWSPTVRPPRLGGNARMGVFATRSPFRPNGLGLSSVVLEKIETHPSWGPVLRVSGADLMSGTPIYDIKPYIPFTDSHPDARTGFVDRPPEKVLHVAAADALLGKLPEDMRAPLLDILAYDPRPSYQDDPGRRYGMRFGDFDVKFTVRGDVLTIADIVEMTGGMDECMKE